MNPVTWFEIPVIDMDRAKAFYEKLFNIKIELNQMAALMGWLPNDPNAGGAAGTLLEGDTYIPSHEGTWVYLS